MLAWRRLVNAALVTLVSLCCSFFAQTPVAFVEDYFKLVLGGSTPRWWDDSLELGRSRWPAALRVECVHEEDAAAVLPLQCPSAIVGAVASVLRRNEK
jgi:hypothetical protein